MSPQLMKAVGRLLDRAADVFSNHGCNDWEYPEDWMEQDRREFASEMVRFNYGIKHEDSPLTADEQEDLERWTKHGPPDWLVMRYLAKRFQEAGE